jgi:Cu/Ag efflux protein CusF
LAGELGLVTFPEAASKLFTGAMVAAADRTEHFDATGTIVAVDAAKPSVTINHGEIKGLMSPMTMAFPVESPELLQGVTPGERVTFQLLRTPKSLSVAALTKETPARAEHIVLDVQGMS